MKTLLLAAIALFFSGPVHAESELPIRVVKYVDILATPGATLECLKKDGKFGYLISRADNGDYIIEVISNGKLEGEKSRMRAEVKDYGSPFIVYLSVYKRQDDYANYFELLLDKKLNIFYGSLVGDAMYTEAFYSKDGDKEKETLKPLWKERMSCQSGFTG